MTVIDKLNKNMRFNDPGKVALYIVLTVARMNYICLFSYYVMKLNLQVYSVREWAAPLPFMHEEFIRAMLNISSKLSCCLVVVNGEHA
jgi:hypothetical protein